MSEGDVERSKLDKAKEVVKKYWKPVTVGVVITGVTFVVTRRISTQYLHIEGTSTFIDKAVVKEGPLYNVFNIYGHGFKNHGPSWMVRCKETGVLFRSQEHAAKTMGLSETHLSYHVRGLRHNVGGYHFERLGVAA
jgi:hypothetical protein